MNSAPERQRFIEFPKPPVPQAVQPDVPAAVPHRLALLCGVTVIHLAVLVGAFYLTVRPVANYDPDKVIDLMNMTQMPPPPKPQVIVKKTVVPVPDEQRTQIKDETKPPTPPETTANPNNGPSDNQAGDNSDNFLPQSQVDVAPLIDAKQIKANTVYPAIAQSMNLEAQVILELFIDKNGNIIHISVLKDPGHGFAEAAVKAFTGVRLTPARASGNPVAVRWRYPIRFTLK